MITFKLPPNLDLPMLPFWQARSFYAQLLLALSVLCNMAGIDMFAALTEIGAGTTPDEVLATGDRVISAWQQLAPLLFGLWAWMERRAPNFRLGLGDGNVGFMPVLLAGTLALVLLAAAPPAFAAACAPAEQVGAVLRDQFAEAPVGAGAIGDMVIVVLAGPEGSWTILGVRPDGIACALMVGAGWTAATLAPARPGVPG
ncbi:MAG: hypothetical protein Q7J57_05880 [Gemmobacter sp.]|nr:hypothetical protein [Gemmobacter sp.]